MKILASIGVTILVAIYVFGLLINRIIESERYVSRIRESDRKVQVKEKKVREEQNRIVLSAIPKEILKPCLDKSGKIADRDNEWNYSDVASFLPQSRLKLACHYPNGDWYIACEKGGYTIQKIQLRASMDSTQHWQTIQLAQEEKETCE